MLEQFSMKGKYVLITGATGHLGKQMALALAGSGAHIFVNSRSIEKATAIVDNIISVGGSASAAIFDASKKNEIIGFAKNTDFPHLSCIINNAYNGSAGTIEISDESQYIKSYEMSVISAHLVVNCFLEKLRSSVKIFNDASVINISSMYGMVSPDLSVYETASVSNPPFYGAAKAALIQWTRYAACEFGHEGIRFNSVSPGPFPSHGVISSNSEFVDKLARKVPLKRVGRPEEIQGSVVFLASPASSFVNGSNITVDGGWTAW